MVTEPRPAARTLTTLRTLAIGSLLAASLAGCSGSGGSGGSLFGPSASSTTSGQAVSSPSPNGVATGAIAASPSPSPGAPGAGGTGAGGIPEAAWINPSAIPLNGAYHWPSPAGAAKAAKSPTLTAVQDCQLNLSSSDKAELGAFHAAQADISPSSGGTGGQDDWSAQETILATGDTSSGDIQGIYNLYTDLIAALGKCGQSASGATVSVAANQGPQYAATITVPTSTGSTLTWHEYLAAPYGYLVELSVWVAPYSGDKPSAAWDGSSASGVLSALQAGPCSITKLC